MSSSSSLLTTGIFGLGTPEIQTVYTLISNSYLASALLSGDKLLLISRKVAPVNR